MEGRGVGPSGHAAALWTAGAAAALQRWLALFVGVAAFFGFLEMLGERLRARLAGAHHVGGQFEIGLLRRGFGRRERGRRRFGRRRRQLRQADRRRWLGDRPRLQRLFAELGGFFDLRGIEHGRFAADAGRAEYSFRECAARAGPQPRWRSRKSWPRRQCAGRLLDVLPPQKFFQPRRLHRRPSSPARSLCR